MAIKKSLENFVLARDSEGKPFSAYGKDDLTGKSDATEHYVFQYGRDENRERVIHSITRGDKPTRDAIKALTAAGQSDEAAELKNPQKVQVMGVEFEVGGPVTGKVVDFDEYAKPESQAAFSHAESDLSNTWLIRDVRIGGEKATLDLITSPDTMTAYRAETLVERNNWLAERRAKATEVTPAAEAEPAAPAARPPSPGSR